VGILAARAVIVDDVLGVLTSAFGTPSTASTPTVFHHTGYYEQEMGPGIRRLYVALDGLWDPGELASLKLRSNQMEQSWARAGKRQVNLDPGLLDLSRLVLASGKPAAHRVYLGQGIYGEVEYLYQRGSFRPLPWTYPDYREQSTIEFFNRLRQVHKSTKRKTYD
jgi:hypothetical protein